VSLPLLDQGGAGFVAGGDMDRLTGCVREAWLEPTRARAQGERGRSFVERYPQAGSVVAELARLLRSVAG
jgi:hypothetical protein